jgi:pantetheine-phosphate adenylyltransferase
MQTEKEQHPIRKGALSGAFRRAVYAGSFSPLTKGHHDIILQAARAFDELYIAVGINHAKQPMFTDQERVAMIEHDVKTHIEPELKKAGVNCAIKVACYDGTTARFMKAVGAEFYVRGLRLGVEFDQELPGIIVSKSLYPAFTPMFFPSTNPKLQTVSSSVARELCRFREDAALDDYLSPHVKQELIGRMENLNMRPVPKL